jgi:hypothetical protein
MMVIGGPTSDPTATAATNTYVLMWDLAFGQMLSYHWRWDGTAKQAIAETPETRWLDLVTLLQKHFVARDAGVPFRAFRELNVGHPHVTAFETAFGVNADDVRIVSNWDAAQTYRVLDGGATRYEVAPNGYVARLADDSALAGAFANTFNAHALSSGAHHVVVLRSPTKVSVRQPIGADTDLYLDPPTGVQPDRLRVTAIDRTGTRVKQYPPTWEGPFIKLSYTRRLDGLSNGAELAGYDIEAYDNVGTIVAPVPGVEPGVKVLNATISARFGCGPIQRIRFGNEGLPFANAQVTITDPTGRPATERSGFTYVPPTDTTSVTLRIERVAQSGGATVGPIRLGDACGEWRTLIGGGAGVW